MPFDFSRFLHSVESRARTVHGLDVAARTLVLSALGTVAAMVCIRLVRLPLPIWALPIFAVPPFAAALAGYFLGRARHPRMPYVLLRIDDSLGLAARLSALYELRHRTETSVFRARLESEVMDATAGWREALPLGRRTLVGGSAGLCCLALSVGLAFVPLPAPQQTPLQRLDASVAGSERSTVADDALPAPTGEVDAPASLVTAPDGPEGAGPGTVGAPERDQTLEDVFRDLSGFTPDEAVLVPLSPEDIADLARVQGEAMRVVAQLLERIQDRLQDTEPSQEPPELTEEELAEIERELERGGIPPDLQEGLEELMEPPPSRTVEEIVEELIQRFGDEEDPQGEGQGEEGAPQTTAVPSDQPGIEDAIDELSRPPDGGESDSGEPGAGPGDSGEGSDGSDADGVESIGGPSDGPGRQGIEDPDQVGGSEGGYSPPGERSEREPGFIREEETGKIGSEGEFVSEFVTEGVPIEVLPDPNGGPTAFRVRYDQIDAVLRERGLPEGAVDIVRDYFNAITEGET